MAAMQSTLLSKCTNDTSNTMLDNIDHQQLCSWLNAVAHNRDKQAFTSLFKFFAPKIVGIANNKFSNLAMSNEVVQETMSNVWRKAHMFDERKGAPTTWVYTVMRNVTFDLLRKVKANKEDTLSDDIWPMVEEAPTSDESFEDHLENKQLLENINALPEAQQQVVKGFYLLEMSQEQLSTHLNLPLGTIKSRLRLALAKLKVQLGEEHD